MRIGALALGIFLAVMNSPAGAGTKSHPLSDPWVNQRPDTRLAASDRVYSARDFLEVCEAEAAGRTGTRRPCAAYISGVFAAKVHFSQSNNKDGICAPAKDVPGERLRDIFIDYTRQNPEALDEERLDAINDAFAESFPCS